jgi:phage N-6-adenine-methyltransferase
MTAPTTRTLGLDDWMTPPEVFDKVHALAAFDLDACATDERCSRLPRFISPEEDALITTWDGRRVWCNPPYGRDIKYWIKRAATAPLQDGCDLVCLLIYANTETRYWREWVVDWPYSHAVVFLSPRVRFLRADGEASAGAPKGSAIVVYQRHRRGSVRPRHAYWDWKTERFPWDVLA